MKTVSIIDFKVGNIYSVVQACKEVGLNVKVTSNYDEILSSDGVILPGVGAFGTAMKNLINEGLDITIKDFIMTNKPFMGICLGLQLLFTESNEFGDNKGLNIIDGSVLKFKNDGMKVPQVGWNEIRENKMPWTNSPLNNIKQGEYMYFVHSYYVKPLDNKYILSRTKYCNFEYCSSIKKDNVFATQFHPEKSGKKGLEIYKNWSKLL
tara:strand:- start:7160 stop:7783 length:624 start_codon:yes stop_codon:yes gene_type:complete